MEEKTTLARVFISYSRDDDTFVNELRDALQSQGVKAWLDRTDTVGGTHWEAAIAEAVQGCDALIAVLSPDAVASTYVPTELSLAREMQRRIIPLFHRRCELTPRMRFLISGLQYIDFEDLGFDEGVRQLLAALAVKVAEPPVRIVSRWWRPRMLAIGGVVLAALTIGLLLVLGRLRQETVPSQEPTVVASVAPAAASGIGGYWQASVNYEGVGTFLERFALNVTGNRLAGTASFRGYAFRRGILEGTVSGDTLSFVIKDRVQDDAFHNPYDVVNEYSGRLVGSEIHFTLQEKLHGDTPIEFVARPISKAEFDRMPTGGIEPEFGGGDAGGLYYDWDHIHEVVKAQDRTIRACYVAAEFDPVDHVKVSFRVTVDRTGRVEKVDFPEWDKDERSAALDACMGQALRAVKYGPTDSGTGGSIVLDFDAPRSWNR